MQMVNAVEKSKEVFNGLQNERRTQQLIISGLVLKLGGDVFLHSNEMEMLANSRIESTQNNQDLHLKLVWEEPTNEEGNTIPD